MTKIRIGDILGFDDAEVIELEEEEKEESSKKDKE